MKLSELDVLIVDDHEAMRVMLTRVLARAGVTAIRGASGAMEALALMAERAPSLVLADQRMPGMDGTAFIGAVRADAALAGVRVVMISGATSEEHFAAAKAAGADAVLVKPVSPRALLEAIEGVMN
ncbi:MAG TPA: response regulator [Vitreimonas sp.]|uniref:response regulator n=1 Tax=Vitreimonas sp. TaxID=3069702 RepID=UPI002D5D9530|nr:response regulator [Vitreimonas sp.]HYD88034.1 response regulator [Vitreimonas sp.]